jgi:uncharacterized protein (UPF0216 family)
MIDKQEHQIFSYELKQLQDEYNKCPYPKLKEEIALEINSLKSILQNYSTL